MRQPRLTRLRRARRLGWVAVSITTILLVAWVVSSRTPQVVADRAGQTIVEGAPAGWTPPPPPPRGEDRRVPDLPAASATGAGASEDQTFAIAGEVREWTGYAATGVWVVGCGRAVWVSGGDFVLRLPRPGCSLRVARELDDIHVLSAPVRVDHDDEAPVVLVAPAPTREVLEAAEPLSDCTVALLKFTRALARLDDLHDGELTLGFEDETLLADGEQMLAEALERLRDRCEGVDSTWAVDP